MPLDIPLVPVNYEAKTFAANALVQAINNLHLAQNTGGGGSTASTEAQKKAAKEDADAKEQARKDAARSQTDKRGVLEQGGVSKITGQPQPRKTGLQMEEGNPEFTPAAPTITPAAPAAGPSPGVTPGQPTVPTFGNSNFSNPMGLGEPPGGGVSGITGTTDQFGNAIPVQEFTGSTGELSAAPVQTSAEEDIFGWGGLF